MIQEVELQHNVTEETKQYTGKGIKIAVLEGSFNVKHPAISHALSEPALWYDGYNNRRGSDPMTDQTTSNFFDTTSYHGNHITALIAGVHHTTGERLGLAPEATIIPVCGSNTLNRTSEEMANYFRALNYLKTIDVKIINISQELQFSQAVQAILVELVEQGKIIVYAADNHSKCLDDKAHPACSFLQNPILRKGLVVVGNLNKNDERSVGANYVFYRNNGSSYVSAIFRGNFIFANGTDRYSAAASDYIKQSGTSMAAPTVAGAIALLWQQNPNFTNEQIIRILIGSSTYIKKEGAVKLNVANMLTKSTQEKILQSEIPPPPPLCTAHNMAFFPDIAIVPNDFSCFISQPLQGNFQFKKLTQDEINTFAGDDLKFLHKENEELIKLASAHSYYGLVRVTANKQYLVMGILALQLDNDLIYIADICCWHFDQREQLMSELAYRLGRYDYQNKYQHVYASWGRFEGTKRYGIDLCDLSKPDQDYFKFIHALPKQTEHFPNIVVTKSDIPHLRDWKFRVLKKIDNFTLHSELINFPDQQKYVYATSKNYHRYVLELDEFNHYFIDAFINQDEEIILVPNITTSHWFLTINVLQIFKEKANQMGFKVIVAVCNYLSVLPLHPIKVNKNLKEPHAFTRAESLETYSLDELDVYGKVGDVSLNEVHPALFDAIIDQSEIEISFFLNKKPDLNKILNRYQQNALHIAVSRTKNLKLVKDLFAAGVDLFHYDSDDLLPVDRARRSRFPEAVSFLEEQMKLQEEDVYAPKCGP